jgi:hypothetical protein
MDAVRYITLTKYKCVYSQRKVLYSTKSLLKYLTKTTFDTRFRAFEPFLEMPKVLKTRKHVTNRIVTKEDVENVLKVIEQAFSIGRVDLYYYLNYKPSCSSVLCRTATFSDNSKINREAI